MDERIHEHTTSSSTTCPSAGPTTLFATTTSGVLKNPIPHQGVMNTQQEVHPAPPQMGQYQNPGPNQPGNLVDRNILLTSEEEILLQTHAVVNTVFPLNLPQPPQKWLQLQSDNH
jgi:hypothetical protein